MKPATPASHWHAEDTAQVMQHWQSSDDGLSQHAAAERLQRYGRNSLPQPAAKSPWLRFVLQFHNLLIYVLLAAALGTLLLADYVDSDNAFIVASTEELTAWPHDPRAAYRTLRYMTDWDSLCAAYRDSYAVAKNDVERYARMSGHAVHNLQKFCSQASAEERLRSFFAQRAQAIKALSVEAAGA